MGLVSLGPSRASILCTLSAMSPVGEGSVGESEEGRGAPKSPETRLLVGLIMCMLNDRKSLP